MQKVYRYSRRRVGEKWSDRVIERVYVHGPSSKTQYFPGKGPIGSQSTDVQKRCTLGEIARMREADWAEIGGKLSQRQARGEASL
jgi:hypothetical protein